MKNCCVSVFIRSLSFASISFLSANSLFSVSSVYRDQNTAQQYKVTGTGFSVLALDSQNQKRLFVVTSAHVSQGEQVEIIDKNHRKCIPTAQLANNLSDIEILEVSHCRIEPMFQYVPGMGFLGNTKSEKLWNELDPSQRASVDAVVVLSSNKEEKFSVWQNLMGDYVSNLQISPGESGFPWVNIIGPRIMKDDEIRPAFNMKLKGIAKGSWRFFKLSKFSSDLELEKLLKNFFAHTSASDLSLSWVVKSEQLTQELTNNTYDLSLEFQHSGNGVGVDSGNKKGLSTQTKSQNPIKKYTELKLGMTYQNNPIIAFKVKAKCSSDNFYFYASMANLVFLKKNSRDFQIVGTLSPDEDLRFVLNERVGFPFIKSAGHFKSDNARLSLNLDQAVRAQQLLVKYRTAKSMIGFDYRNLFFIDVEELMNEPESICEVIKEHWYQYPFAKSFSFENPVSPKNSSTKEFLIKRIAEE